MIIRLYRRGKDVILAACDNDLLGSTLGTGELTMHISRGFYGDEQGDRQDLIAALRSCTTANLVGPETVSIAIEAGFIDPNGVILIDGVPHAQLFKLFG